MIVSRQNQKIKDIRRLRRCKGERAILEGPHLVSEALGAGLDIDFVLTTPEFADSETGRQLLRRSAFPTSQVTPRLFDEICDADSPRGIMAVAEVPLTVLAAVPVVDNGIYLFVDGLQDPGNLGALIRIGEGFGAVALILGHGTVHPNHPRALRASAGSRLRTLTVVDITPDELESHLSPGAPRWAVLTPRGGQLLTEVPSGGSLILAVGAEGPGISDEVAARADIRLTIPLAGKVESLNSTVAAAIALYEISRTEPLL